MEPLLGRRKGFFRIVPAKNVVSALVDASPNLRRRDSIDRRRTEPRAADAAAATQMGS